MLALARTTSAHVGWLTQRATTAGLLRCEALAASPKASASATPYACEGCATVATGGRVGSRREVAAEASLGHHAGKSAASAT